MADATHIIHRQVLDITLDTERDAYLVQEEVRRIYYDRIIPLLDDAFSEVVGPDEIVRLDRLELDLGHLDRRTLEEDLVSEVRLQVQEALVRPLKALPFPDEAAVTRSTPVASKLEAFVSFLRTGRLPWWAPDHAAFTPSAVLATLIDDEAGALIAALRSVPGRVVSRRLAQQVTPDGLARLVRLLLPAEADAVLGVRQQIQALHDDRPLLARSPAAFATVLWVATLDHLLTPPVPASEVVPYVEALAETLAREGLPVARLVARLKAAPETVRAAPPVLALWVAQARTTAPPVPDPIEERPKPVDTPPTPRADRPEPPAVASPEVSAEQAGPAAVEALPRKAPPDSKPGPDTGTTSPEAPAEGKTLGGRPPTVIPGETTSTEPATPSTEKPTPPAEPAAERPHTPIPFYTDVAGAGEALYITNAGLVLLWPFLTRFFEQVHLVEDKAFVSDEAWQRAVLLTHYLGTGESEISEHRLLLNKLLCGWPMHESVPRQFMPTPTEEEQSIVLLQTVITHWAALKNTSVDGLRQAFLQRPGKLVREPEQWMLTIERTGYDVLLEQLPWSFSVIKLSWMPHPLFVEW